MALHVSCPHCGSSELAHVQRALVAYQVKAFDKRDDGTVFGVEFTGPERVDWESAENVEFPWSCLTCKAELADDDLVVVHTRHSVFAQPNATKH